MSVVGVMWHLLACVVERYSTHEPEGASVGQMFSFESIKLFIDVLSECYHPRLF